MRSRIAVPKLIGDPTYAEAILHRIARNAHQINLTGYSLWCSRASKVSKRIDRPDYKMSIISAWEAPEPWRHHAGIPGGVISGALAISAEFAIVGTKMNVVHMPHEIHLSVVVPVYNEHNGLDYMADQLAPKLDEIAGRGRWQFVLVDNGSTDASPAICAEIAERNPGSIVARLQQPNYGEALYQGLIRATGPWAFIINVDFWDVTFMRWCFQTRGAYDLVIGSKRADFTLNQQDNYRRMLSWGLNTILRTLLGFVGSDTHGQKFLYLPALRPIFEQCVMRRGQFDTEFTLRASRARLWLAEVPVPIVELRKPRNLMIHKIAQNVVDITRLYRLMRKIPARSAMCYHRWSRDDVEAPNSAQTALLVEVGRLHRRDTLCAETTTDGLSQQSRHLRGVCGFAEGDRDHDAAEDASDLAGCQQYSRRQIKDS